MFKFNNILAIVDFRQEQHYALPRAIELANKFNSKLTVVSNSYESFMELIPSSSAIDKEAIKKEAIEQEIDRLKALVEGISSKLPEISYQVTWDRAMHKGLSRFINTSNFDLVVKTARKHNSLEKFFFTPTDWHLLRDTKTSILFVKTEKWLSKSSILGAINIEDDQEHSSLNEKIIQTTVELARSLDCNSNILNVFPWPMVKFDRFNHLFDKKDLFLTIKEKHIKEVNRVVDSVSNISGKVIIAEGLETEEAIPEIAKSTFSNMLVMGTVGRKGVEGAFIGNTAEKILDHIDCEVLTIK